ncbi:hypothetical protein MMC09_000450 [Bachmanniomyces sp. S44760]|nr:hypothetical protein [Bachmanniomyces sp. S44760]
MDLERDEVDFKQVDSEEGKVTLFPSAPQPYIFEKEEYSKLERIFHLNQWDWNSMVIRQNWMNVVVSGLADQYPVPPVAPVLRVVPRMSRRQLRSNPVYAPFWFQTQQKRRKNPESGSPDSHPRQPINYATPLPCVEPGTHRPCQSLGQIDNLGGKRKRTAEPSARSTKSCRFNLTSSPQLSRSQDHVIASADSSTREEILGLLTHPRCTQNFWTQGPVAEAQGLQEAKVFSDWSNGPRLHPTRDLLHTTPNLAPSRPTFGNTISVGNGVEHNCNAEIQGVEARFHHHHPLARPSLIGHPISDTSTTEFGVNRDHSAEAQRLREALSLYNSSFRPDTVARRAIDTITPLGFGINRDHSVETKSLEKAFSDIHTRAARAASSDLSALTIHKPPTLSSNHRIRVYNVPPSIDGLDLVGLMEGAVTSYKICNFPHYYVNFESEDAANNAVMVHNSSDLHGSIIRLERVVKGEVVSHGPPRPPKRYRYS